MAVVLGTNAGFVTVAPSTAPIGLNFTTDGYARCTKHVCPAETTVTEIGWYTVGGHTAGAFKVGIYSHDSGSDTADALLFSQSGGTTSGVPGWQVISGLDWELTEGVTYWVAITVLAVSGSTTLDYSNNAGRSGTVVPAFGDFPDPFSSGSDTTQALAIYALVESGVIDEGTKTVTVAAVISLSTDMVAITEGVKTVTVAVTVSLASENYVNQSGFPTDRPSDYDGDSYWDEDSGTWGSTRTTHPGNWVQNVLAISEQGEIYFRTL